MDECREKPAHISAFATELLLDIFKFVSPKDLTSCRQVCRRWKDVFDDFSSKDKLWKQYCTSDFNTLYEAAKRKNYSCLSWFDIYKSLTLWGRLAAAAESIDEFCHASAVAEEIRDMYFLNNGIILIVKRGYISFYDLTTFEKTNQNRIFGDYTKYMDCDDVVVTLGMHLHLTVIRKPLTEFHLRRPEQQFQVVKFFVIIDRDIYFVDLYNDLYQYNIDGQSLKELEKPSTNNIVTLSNCNGCFHHMTIDKCIYAYQNNEFVKVCSLNDQPNIFDCIYQYKLFEQMQWYMFYMWMVQMRASIPIGPLQHISVMKEYGNTIFIGTNTGLLLIYYKPFTNGQFDIFNKDPVKQFNFVERKDIPVLSQQQIVAIDVVEIKHGHKILVAMLRKIIVITLTHGIDTVTCKSVLPYIQAGPLSVIH